jgi:hypothetical protein
MDEDACRGGPLSVKRMNSVDVASERRMEESWFTGA